MELLAIFGINVSEWISGAGAITIAGIIVTILRKKGYVLAFKRIANTSAKISKQLGEAFLESSDVFEKIDLAIKEDGRLKENCVKDVIAEGKEALIEWKDVIVSIKPK